MERNPVLAPQIRGRCYPGFASVRRAQGNHDTARSGQRPTTILHGSGDLHVHVALSGSMYACCMLNLQSLSHDQLCRRSILYLVCSSHSWENSERAPRRSKMAGSQAHRIHGCRRPSLSRVQSASRFSPTRAWLHCSTHLSMCQAAIVPSNCYTITCHPARSN